MDTPAHLYRAALACEQPEEYRKHAPALKAYSYFHLPLQFLLCWGFVKIMSSWMGARTPLAIAKMIAGGITHAVQMTEQETV